MANLAIDWNIDDVVYGNVKKITTEITIKGETSLIIDNFQDVKITKINDTHTMIGIIGDKSKTMFLEETDYNGKKIYESIGENYVQYTTFHYEQNIEYAKRTHKTVVSEFLTKEFVHLINKIN